MLRTKRDVDRHVDELESKIQSESERNVKAFTIAKYYFNVGEYETARKYLVKYISIKPNSSLALKLNGQILEALKQHEKAIKSYQQAFEIDPTLKDVILKICEILLAQGDKMDKGMARRWLELGEKHYPKHQTIRNLYTICYEAMKDSNGNTQDSTVTDHVNGEDEQINEGQFESSLLWSSSGNPGGSRVQVVGPPSSTGYPMGMSTPTRPSLAGVNTLTASDSPRKFLPRPSPERLSAQVNSLESTQEKMIELMISGNRQLVDEFKNHSLAILQELKFQRQNMVEELRTNRQNLADFRLEMKQNWCDLKLEVSKLQLRHENSEKEARSRNGDYQQSRGQSKDGSWECQGCLAGLMATNNRQLADELKNHSHDLLQELRFQRESIIEAMKNNKQNVADLTAQGILDIRPGVSNLQTTQESLRKETSASHVGVSVPAKPSQGLLHDVFATVKESPRQETSASNVNVSVPAKPTERPTSATHQGHLSTKAPIGVSPGNAAASNQGSDNLFAKFKPKEGSWECQGCFIRNEAQLVKCPACETFKPGYEKEEQEQQVTVKPTFTFGSQGGFKFTASTVTTTAAVASSVVTSIPKPTTSSASPFSGFTFSGPVLNLSSTTTTPQQASFTFTSPKQKEEEVDPHLSFEGQGLKLNTAADAAEVAGKIAKAKKMTELTLAGNTIGIEAAEAIGKSLEKHPEFQRAHWKDMFTGRMKTEIPPALKHLGRGIMLAQAKLVELDLSDNAFGPVGMQGIEELLRSPSCYTLQELRLNNTGCGETGGKLLAQALTECYKESKLNTGKPLSLRVFVLGRSRQELGGAKALAEVFKLMGSLEEVVMPQNGIYHEGITALVDAFGNNPNLHTINLNDNTFTEKGAESFARVLPKLQKLQYLNLGDCLLKTGGAQLIVDALRGGHNDLEELHLDANEIKLDGGKAIVEMAVVKPKLKKLSIGGNRFGAGGCQQLMEMLGYKESLVDGEIEGDEGDSEDEEDVHDEEAYGEDYDDEKEGYEDDYYDEGEDDYEEPHDEVDEEEDASKDDHVSSSTNDNVKDLSTAVKNLSTVAAQPVGIFGKGDDQKTNSPFSFSFQTPVAPTTSIFGSSVQTDSATSGKDMPSFASIGSSEFVFGKSNNPSFTFAGAGASLFQATSSQSPKKDGEDEPHAEDEHHDPHFEPIIPLPELVPVTTGEEEEELIFKHRAKVYRFDTETKQWKERGVGDMKILKHPEKKTFRVLLRRDQIHKIACNHLITKDMDLKPMFGSETAVCWFAMDYADEEPKVEHLAVKFKLEETKNEFKKKFEECRAQVESKVTS